MAESLEKVFERETENMTPLAVYEATQRHFRYDLELRMGDPKYPWGWTLEDMLSGKRLPWKKLGGKFVTYWFCGLSVTLGADRG